MGVLDDENNTVPDDNEVHVVVHDFLDFLPSEHVIESLNFMAKKRWIDQTYY
jgi:hypothetical protein